MSGPDETLPPDDTPKPIHERPTLGDLPPVNDTIPPPADTEPPSHEFGEPEFMRTPLPAYEPALVIPRGQAQFAFNAAMADLARAFEIVEATGMACARQLDLQEEP